MKFFILAFVSIVNLYGFVDMSDVPQRALDLNMTVQDYSFAMALSGTLSGSILGIFIWKVK